jgi:hypothetical protein
MNVSRYCSYIIAGTLFISLGVHEISYLSESEKRQQPFLPQGHFHLDPPPGYSGNPSYTEDSTIAASGFSGYSGYSIIQK